MSKKKKKLLCSITGIVAMLFVVLIAFGYPNLVISLRDHRMKDQESHYKSTPIKIVQDKVGFFDRVSIADDLIWNNSYTEVFGYIDSKFEMDQDTALEKCIEHYYELFRSCCTDNNQDIVSLDDFKRTIDEKNTRIEPVLFMDTTMIICFMRGTVIYFYIIQHMCRYISMMKQVSCLDFHAMKVQ